jgi:uncharacterized protein (UPF0332 family)
MGIDALAAATKLLELGHVRSCVSRSYYAGYCAATGALATRGLAFARGWGNPGHDRVPDLILHNTDLPQTARFQLNKALRRLRKLREDADYRPTASLDRADALGCLRDAAFVMRTLGAGSHE